MTLNYILETTVCWLFFYLLYALWLRKETFFTANRAYLIGTLLLGLLIPAIAFMPTPQPVIVQDVTIFLNEITITANTSPKPDAGLQISEIPRLIYWAGVAVCLLRFLVGIGGILRLFIGSEITRKTNYTLVHTAREHAPFSFLNFFFVSKKMNLSEAEWQQVTQHEEAHIRGVHTLDVLLVEVLAIVFWFNPLIYLYKHAVRDVHEYLADAAVVKTVSTVHYGRFLVSIALPGFRMANNFNHSQLKKRIIMMTKSQSSKFALAKYVLFIPLTILMLLVFSCQETITEEAINNQAVNTKQAQSTTAKVKRADVYDIVDEMPRFPDCENIAGTSEERQKCSEQKMLEYIYTNITYPAEAITAGIEGMVVVSFIVETDGRITNVEILRSIGYETDEEVLRIVESMPNWTPGIHEGEAVRVEFKLPIRFRLEGNG